MASMSMVGTRRSPRSIEHLCNTTSIPSLSSEQTGTLLSLAHCTGWSADQIANKFAQTTGILITPEAVWDYHWSWIFSRDVEEILTSEWKIMRVLMGNIGVYIEKPEKPLSGSARPKTVKFAEQWSPKNPEGRSLFAGWTADCREASKGYLLIQKNYEIFGQLTPIEERVLAKFGENMLHIFRKTLRRWSRAMLDKVAEDPGLRPIKEREHVDLIMEYLKVFQKLYEEKFGKMEVGKPSSAFGEIKDDVVCIKSTGYGVKVVLGLLMADRMCVLRKRRKLEREIIGFMEAEPEEVEQDSKNCPICQDPMGVESSSGTKEAPLRMVICCGQVLGAQCLRAWLGELGWDGMYRNTCPHCRYKLPESFMKSLFSKEEYAARIARVDEEFEIVRQPSQPAMPLRSQQEQDTLLEEHLGEGGEDEMMDIDNVSQVLRSPSLGMGEVEGPITVERSASHQVDLGDPAEDEFINDNFDMEG